MEVPTKKMRTWEKYIDHGDITKIAEQSNVRRATLSITYNYGRGPIDAILAIDKFVNAKKELVK